MHQVTNAQNAVAAPPCD